MQDFMPFFRKDMAIVKWADEQEMVERIEGGEQLWDIEEMTPEYFRLATQIVLMQADSEFAGAYGYNGLVPIIQGYSLEEMLIVSETAYEEFGHAMRCFRILEEMGFDANRWVRTHGWLYRWRMEEHETFAGLGRRPTNDCRVNIFYYPLMIPDDFSRFARLARIHTAIRFAVFQFLQDRGAGVQLKDALISSFGPWAQENYEIMLEEQDHLKHGEKKLAELRREHTELVDQEIKLWLPRAIATFGKPHSKFDDQLRKYRITSRTHEEKLRDFFDGDEGIHTANERSNIGLTLPTMDEIIAMWREGEYLKEV